MAPANVCCSSSCGSALTWAGRILGTGLLLLFLAFWVGEGPPPASIFAVALLVMLAGFAVSWWHGLIGGVMSVAGIATFYGLHFAESARFPGGWVFPLCFVPGVLCIVGWLSQRCRRSATPPA